MLSPDEYAPVYKYEGVPGFGGNYHFGRGTPEHTGTLHISTPWFINPGQHYLSRLGAISCCLLFFFGGGAVAKMIPVGLPRARLSAPRKLCKRGISVIIGVPEHILRAIARCTGSKAGGGGGVDFCWDLKTQKPGV